MLVTWTALTEIVSLASQNVCPSVHACLLTYTVRTFLYFWIFVAAAAMEPKPTTMMNVAGSAELAILTYVRTTVE